ncbi:hypothetical protein KFK09_024122 [Dendrobium nobile]|uniref:Uncharacterized protein n=1 Tax=Dendrobium nobile TaxID=94219 RepID=A0A8T3AD52_DENNO|nr:hypothetical protein KFK09_024122 [Dendrobium nobile]
MKNKKIMKKTRRESRISSLPPDLLEEILLEALAASPTPIKDIRYFTQTLLNWLDLGYPENLYLLENFLAEFRPPVASTVKPVDILSVMREAQGRLAGVKVRVLERSMMNWVRQRDVPSRKEKKPLALNMFEMCELQTGLSVVSGVVANDLMLLMRNFRVGGIVVLLERGKEDDISMGGCIEQEEFILFGELREDEEGQTFQFMSIRL